jgi:hypothetical protein
MNTRASAVFEKVHGTWYLDPAQARPQERVPEKDVWSIAVESRGGETLGPFESDKDGIWVM